MASSVLPPPAAPFSDTGSMLAAIPTDIFSGITDSSYAENPPAEVESDSSASDDVIAPEPDQDPVSEQQDPTPEPNSSDSSDDQGTPEEGTTDPLAEDVEEGVIRS